MMNHEYSHTATKVQANARVASDSRWRTAPHHHASQRYALGAEENQTQMQQRVYAWTAEWEENNKFQEKFLYERLMRSSLRIAVTGEVERMSRTWTRRMTSGEATYFHRETDLDVSGVERHVTHGRHRSARCEQYSVQPDSMK